MRVTLAYENGDVNTLNFGKTENFYLTGQYTFGNNIIRGSYGYNSPDDGQFILPMGSRSVTQSDLNNYALGYQYNFSKRTRAWVEWKLNDVDSEFGGRSAGGLHRYPRTTSNSLQFEVCFDQRTPSGVRWRFGFKSCFNTKKLYFSQISSCFFTAITI